MSAGEHTIRHATADDYDAVASLLTGSALPLDGAYDALPGFVIAESEREVVGVAGIEYCGAYGLLRSAAVHPEWRGRGLGRELVERVLNDARERAVQELYLLTTTAERYFPAFGFVVADRADVPDPIRATTEFTTACPASATVMKLALQ